MHMELSVPKYYQWWPSSDNIMGSDYFLPTFIFPIMIQEKYNYIKKEKESPKPLP